MELESGQNSTPTQNVFYSRTTIHPHTKRVYSRTTIHTHTLSVVCKYKTSFTNECILLQKQQSNIFLKLQNNILQVQTKIFKVQTKLFQVQKKILQVKNTFLQVRKSESCAWSWRHLWVDQQGRTLVPKGTWQTNVLWFTLHNSSWRCWVSLRCQDDRHSNTVNKWP